MKIINVLLYRLRSGAIKMEEIQYLPCNELKAIAANTEEAETFRSEAHLPQSLAKIYYRDALADIGFTDKLHYANHNFREGSYNYQEYLLGNEKNMIST